MAEACNQATLQAFSAPLLLLLHQEACPGWLQVAAARSAAQRPRPRRSSRCTAGAAGGQASSALALPGQIFWFCLLYFSFRPTHNATEAKEGLEHGGCSSLVPPHFQTRCSDYSWRSQLLGCGHTCSLCLGSLSVTFCLPHLPSLQATLLCPRRAVQGGTAQNGAATVRQAAAKAGGRRQCWPLPAVTLLSPERDPLRSTTPSASPGYSRWSPASC